ncbi:MAG: glycosyltransferase family 4 protein, partial [Elusimicrobia bacterium]|nr:glycosyltransferase family 4 protein [Elusimicrobiota bacterium]
MNIIHITDSHEFSGGVVQIKLLMEGLRDRGIKQMIVCPSGGTVAGTFQQAGFRVHTLDMFQDYDVIAAWRLAKLIRQEKPDLVHAHHPTAHAVTLVAAHFIRFRLVVSRRVTHRIKPFPTSRWKYGSKKISRFICVSDAVRRELRRSGVSGERLAVVGSSTNLERFSPRPPSQRVLNELEKIGEVAVPNGNRPPLIAVIANYSSWKGQDLFLEAFARVPAGPMAVLAGRDTDGPAMRERV